MTKVNHYSETVHLADNPLAKFAHSIMSGFPTATVADVVITVMAEGDIHHSPIGKVLDIVYITLESQTILYAKHYGLKSSTLVGPQLVGSACKGEILTVFGYNVFYLVEYQVSIFLGTVYVEAHILTECLILLGLRQICHHDCRVLSAVGHLVQINKELRVAAVEAHSIGKEHRRVAMGVESKYAVMHRAGLTIMRSLSHKPLE